MAFDVREITERVREQSRFVKAITDEIGKVIVGQKYMIERLLIGLLADGHVLVEGVPGLAKTTAVRCLADAVKLKFQRLQFTPDLLPADLIGTLIYNPKTGEFTTRKGPLFANIILADEINRAPAKVQSALLEAMQERQVTIGENTFPLDEPFLVMATQNPIEQEGTYPLPEAQVDRFMLKLRITYPNKQEERQIMERIEVGRKFTLEPVISPEDIVQARNIVNEVYIDDKIKDYIVDIVLATREGVRVGPGTPYRVRCIAARFDLPQTDSARVRFSSRTRVREPAGCEVRRDGCPAPPYHHHLRGGSGRDDK